MLEHCLFVANFVSLPLLWLFMLRSASVELFRISIPSVLMISIFLFQYIGFPILFFEANEYRAQTINDQATIWLAFACSSVTITLLILGFLIARYTLGRLHGGPIYTAAGNRPIVGGSLETLFVYVIALTATLVLLKYVQIVGFSNLAIVSALDFASTDSTSATLRSDMGSAFSGKYHWYRFFMRDLLLISCFALFAKYLIKPRLYSLVPLGLLFLVAAFSVLMASEKSPILWFIIGLVMVFFIVRNDGLVPMRAIFCLFCVVLILVGYMYIYIMDAPSLFTATQRGLSRAITGQMVGTYHYLQIFPGQVDYLHGASFPNPGGIFPWEPYRLTVEVMHIVKPQLTDRGVIGSMPTFFWGEMYANFGYVGVVLPPVFLGIGIYWLSQMISRVPPSILTIAFYVWLILHIRRLSTTGLGKFLVDIEFLLLALLLGIIMTILGRGVIHYRRRKIYS